MQSQGVVKQRFMLLFHQAVLESFKRYGIKAWYGALSVQLKTQINRLVQTALKTFGVKNHPSLQRIYEQAVFRQAEIFFCFTQPTTISSFYLVAEDSVPKCKPNHYKH